jgi:hypothetical protein
MGRVEQFAVFAAQWATHFWLNEKDSGKQVYGTDQQKGNQLGLVQEEFGRTRLVQAGESAQLVEAQLRAGTNCAGLGALVQVHTAAERVDGIAAGTKAAESAGQVKAAVLARGSGGCK